MALPPGPLRRFSIWFISALARPRLLAAWFLLCALPAGLGCALLTPIGMFADEPFHAARADGLRHGEIFGRKPPPGTAPFFINQGMMVDNSFDAVLHSPEFAASAPDRPLPAEDRRQAEAIHWQAGSSFYPTQMVEYLPLFYVPGALGLLAGQIAGLSPLDTFYLGRLAMLCVFLILGTLAIRLARCGNGLIFAVLTLPTTINLGSSYNQDGQLIALCALVAALLTRGGAASWGAALVLLSAALCAKAPYAALLLFCLAPLARPGLARRLGLVLLACVPPGLWLLHVMHAGFIPYQSGPYYPGPLWPGPHRVMLAVNPHDNLLSLLAHPWQIVRMPVATVIWRWPYDWRLLLGMISCDDVQIRPWEYPCLAAALLAAACGSVCGERPAGWRAMDGVLSAAALFCAFLGMELAIYLTFTLVGFDLIIGVQSRYFLPLLPFLIFLLPLAARPLPRLAAGWFTLPAAAMAAVNAYALPAYIFHLFRMPGP